MAVSVAGEAVETNFTKGVNAVSWVLIRFMLVMVPIVWFLELFSTVLRVLTLAVRLYGNMFAGHMVLGIFALLTSVFIGSAIQGAGVGVGSISIAWMLFLFAMYALEVLVAFLQAYVFTILSAVYIGLATSDH